MSKPAPLSVSVTRTIHARPDTVYDLISDITRMSNFSPETTGAHGWPVRTTPGRCAVQGHQRHRPDPLVDQADRHRRRTAVSGSPSQCRAGPGRCGPTCSTGRRRHPGHRVDEPIRSIACADQVVAAGGRGHATGQSTCGRG